MNSQEEVRIAANPRDYYTGEIRQFVPKGSYSKKLQQRYRTKDGKYYWVNVPLVIEDSLKENTSGNS